MVVELERMTALSTALEIALDDDKLGEVDETKVLDMPELDMDGKTVASWARSFADEPTLESLDKLEEVTELEEMTKLEEMTELEETSEVKGLDKLEEISELDTAEEEDTMEPEVPGVGVTTASAGICALDEEL